MKVTWLDNNTWLWETAGQRILVDPWLVGPLMFGGAGWLFRGIKSRPCPIPASIDLILLSQGLEDHAHPETLRALDKTIPVLASPTGARVATDLGFNQVTAIASGEVQTFADITIKALPGAPMGPLRVENGYLLTNTANQITLFYEPHGFHPHSLRSHGPVDVVITPMQDLALPVVGAILRGRQSARELADWLQPQVMLPTAGAGESEYQGVLLPWLKVSGSVETVRAELVAQGNSAQVIEPQVGVAVELSLRLSTVRQDG